MTEPCRAPSFPTFPLLKPPALQPGDTLAAVTLSWGGPGAIPGRYAAGKRQLEAEFGVRLVETRHALRDPAWIAANPEARASDLMEAFADPEIRGIVSTIGGDDSLRILPFLDLGVIRAHPKVFMGYSDTTVSLLACFAAGLVSFHGPAIMSGFAENGGMHRYLVDSVRRSVFSRAPIGEVSPNPAGWTVERLDWHDPALQTRARALQPAAPWRWLQGEGRVSGHLLGGCAEVLEMLKGTPTWPTAWDGAILFLETSEEAPPVHYFRRWLRNFGAQGVLHRVAAILLGRPGGGVPDHEVYDRALVGVVTGELGLSRLPIVAGMDFGHTDPFFVLPVGVRAELDCGARTFAIVESGVV